VSGAALPGETSTWVPDGVGIGRRRGVGGSRSGLSRALDGGVVGQRW
jgi:hypothetical protein